VTPPRIHAGKQEKRNPARGVGEFWKETGRGKYGSYVHGSDKSVNIMSLHTFACGYVE
jgi:hypothetical protein